ncbi:hypothetical protein [Brachybacterium fresconis]|uniref:Uncharacterized protein n=1 Tax=Brachybacterium fresconis TaxID=173363 RepID=A0ABS4YJB4_9MICO|nr:hypothetical protein [Brachybacterium fresconis]MBP2408814.1 hypothetical protein [Brachybacterium fresconis]
MTMTMTARRSFGLAALALAAPLVLSACGGSTDASTGDGPAEAQENVYEFAQPTYAGDAGALEVRIPESLMEAAGEDMDGLLVSGMAFTPHELESADRCAVDLQVAYAGDGKSTLEASGQSAAESVEKQKETFDADLQAALDQLGYASWDEFVAAAGTEEAIEQMDVMVGPVTADGELDVDALERQAQESQGTPRGTLLSALGLPGDPGNETGQFPDGALALDALDEADPETGAYASDDGSDITLVQPCASSVSDEDSATFTLRLPKSGEDDTTSDAASFTFTVMRSGEIGVLEGEVDGYTTDSNGDWITD